MREICEDKGIPYDSVLETVEAALAAAYRKDFGEKNQNVKVRFDPETAAVSAFDEKEVVADEFVAAALAEIEERQRQRQLEEETRARGELPPAPPEPPPQESEPTMSDSGVVKYNPKLHIALAAAREHEPETKVGDTIRIPLPVPGSFGRMAAQTAKQVIMQRLREAERDTVFNQWKSAEGTVVLGTVQRREGRSVLIDLGPRATAILREEDQIPTDRYTTGTRVQVFLSAVGKTIRGPELLVSRTHSELIRHLFSVEVPEVSNGTVQLVAIAREPGSRAKVAVRSTEENVDPIGACIGQRGTRVQTIIAELSGEKIDIIQHDPDDATFIANAMSPAKATRVMLDLRHRVAIVYVPADQFSLAIGRSGQNVRLAARLTGWKISVRDAADEGGASVSMSPEAEASPGGASTGVDTTPSSATSEDASAPEAPGSGAPRTSE